MLRPLPNRITGLRTSWLYYLSTRNCSTENMSAVQTKISSHLTMRQAPGIGGRKSSLVVFFPWLYASRQAVDKYCDVYHERGYDVLSVTCQLKHFLLPSTSGTVARELLGYLMTSQADRTSYVIHASSVGAYVYTVVLLEIVDNLAKYAPIKDRIRGQIFDSITVGGLKQMANGIALRSKNVITQNLIRGGANSYFLLTWPITVRFYNKTIDLFWSAPCRTPVLFYYSLNDTMSDPETMEKLIKHWKEEHRMDVAAKYWEKSIHAGHLRTYPDEYLETLDNYLKGIETTGNEKLTSKL